MRGSSCRAIGFPVVRVGGPRGSTGRLSGRCSTACSAWPRCWPCWTGSRAAAPAGSCSPWSVLLYWAGPAIRSAARGETVLAPTVATRLVNRMRVPAEETLTSREIEVLELVARGSSNAEVAASLFISEATVKTHLLHIFAKLGVDDRTAAVVSALERGIIALSRRKA